MADATFKWGRFKWDRAGYAEAQSAPALQAILRSKALSIAATATSMLGEDGHTVQAFTAKPFKGKLASGYSVKANSKHARYAQAKHKVLTKAASAARG